MMSSECVTRERLRMQSLVRICSVKRVSQCTLYNDDDATLLNFPIERNGDADAMGDSMIVLLQCNPYTVQLLTNVKNIQQNKDKLKLLNRRKSKFGRNWRNSSEKPKCLLFERLCGNISITLTHCSIFVTNLLPFKEQKVNSLVFKDRSVRPWF